MRSSGMTKVVELSIVKEQRRLSVEEAWQRFTIASDKAKSTGDIQDGIEAGKRYADFLELFVRRAS